MARLALMPEILQSIDSIWCQLAKEEAVRDSHAGHGSHSGLKQVLIAVEVTDSKFQLLYLRMQSSFSHTVLLNYLEHFPEINWAIINDTKP